MYGWIVSPYSDNDDGNGIILGTDGKTYLYRIVPDEGILKEERPVSFDPSCFPGTKACAENVTDSPSFDDGSSVTETMRNMVRDRLSYRRYLHSFRVSKISRAMALKYGADPDKAETAGLLHDLAKENPKEENLRLIREKGIPLASFEVDNHLITHAYAGSVIASDVFGISDRQILAAIKYHSGRPTMKALEKIVFLADHLDKGYTLGMDTDYIFKDDSLDGAILKTVSGINGFFVKRREVPDTVTEYTMNYLLSEKAHSDHTDSSGSLISDELFDRALEINLRSSLGLRSVPNARDLGGYASSFGGTISRGKLFRSSRLSSVSDDDLAKLKELGIDTVIDLRTEDEVKASPDRTDGCFDYISCPMPSVEISEYQKELAEKYSITGEKDEQAFYMSEYISCVDMLGMYNEVLTDRDSTASIRKIFDTLADETRGGILFHCTSGKDRTGIVSALIMSVLGAGLNDIRDEYYASAVPTFASTEAMAQKLRRHGYGSAFIDEMRYYNGIGMNLAEEVFMYITSEYGSLQKYVTDGLLIGEDELSVIRERYLERPVPGFFELGSITVRPVIDDLDVIQERMDAVIRDAGIGPVISMKIHVVMDEIFSNIVKYADASEIKIGYSVAGGMLSVSFSNDGVPFDHASAIPKEPVLDDGKRRIGGMGITIVKAYTDDIKYEYTDGKNVLTVVMTTY